MRTIILILFLTLPAFPQMLQGIVGGKVSAVAFDPSQLSGLKGWYSSDSLTCTSGCSGTNVVTALVDKSSNGNNITTTNSPTFYANAVNSKPAVYFNATSSQYGTFGTSINLQSGLTIFFVGSLVSANDAEAIVSGAANSFLYGTAFNSATRHNASAKTGIAWFSFGTAAQTTTGYHQMSVTYKDYSAGGSGVAYRLDRSSDGGNATQAGAITANETSVFWRPATSDFYGWLYFVELIIYDRVLNSTEIGQVETYLNGMYGI